MVEQIERQVLADRQVAAVFRTAGAKKVEFPEVAKVREQFDRDLHAMPTVTPDHHRVVLEALGVRRAS